jgi:tetratricopeptide (TPR) repeat protein
LIFAASLVAAALLAYAGSFTAPFLFDDDRWILENPQFRDFASDWGKLSLDERPLLFLSLGVNYALGGLDVRGYHAFNFGVHAVAGLLLFGIIRRLIRRVNRHRSGSLPACGLAFAIALIWLIHPLQTESVTYVIQRCESMMGMFFLLCLYSVVRGAEARRAWPWYVAAVAACCLGMGCKEVMVTAPPVALLLDRAFLASSWGDLFRRRGALHAVLFATALALLVVTLPKITGGGDGSAGFASTLVTPVAYLRTQPGVILHYLRLAFWPRPLCLDYQWPAAESPREIYPPAAAIVTMLVASVVAFRYWPSLGFLGLSFFFVLAPTSSIIPIADLAFEHRMYLPLAAVVALAAFALYGLGRWSVRDPLAQRVAAVGGLVAIAFMFTLLTWERNGDYRDRTRMWAKVLAVAPRNDRAHFSLGQAYRAQGDLGAARRCYERCLRLAPNFARGQGALGYVLLRQGDLPRSAEHLRRAIGLQPDYLHALINYGNLLVRQNRFEEAAIFYRRALVVAPTNAAAHTNLGSALLKSGRPGAAMAAYRRALQEDPKLVAAKVQLAWVLATTEERDLRSGAEAVRLAEEVRAEFGEGSARPQDVLAAAYAEVGRFDDACRAAAKGLELAAADGPKEDMESLRARLKLYRNRKPYREKGTSSAAEAFPDSLENNP